MKLFILSLCMVLAAADVSHLANDESNAPILAQELDQSPDGSYKFSYETGNGIRGSQLGTIKNAGSEEASQSVQGEASWTSPEGQPIGFQFIADENGYQPQGDILPTPPPIPEAILRALEYIAANPPKPEKNL